MDSAALSPGYTATTAWRSHAFWQGLLAEPHRHDWFHTLRWIDARAGSPQPLGHATHPGDEPVRLQQEPSLAFAPATLARARDDGGTPQIALYHLGLFGPNGPLPLHLTEYARERLHHHDDPGFVALADLFHHRAMLLFYRAWADAQPTVGEDRSRERGGAGRFAEKLACLLSRGLPAQAGPSPLPRAAVLHQAGQLLRQTRSPEALVSIVSRDFGVPVQVREWVGQWMPLQPADAAHLGRSQRGLGHGGLLGRAVWDAQSHIEVVLGPLSLSDYHAFLPGGRHEARLQAWLHEILGLEVGWRIRLVLAQPEVPRLSLQGKQPLGRLSWLGRRAANADEFTCTTREKRSGR